MRQRLKCRNGGREKKKKGKKKREGRGKKPTRLLSNRREICHRGAWAKGDGTLQRFGHWHPGGRRASIPSPPAKKNNITEIPAFSFSFFFFFFWYQGNKAVNKRKSDTVSRGVITWEGRSAWETAAAMQQRCNAPGMLQAHQGHAGLEATTPGQSPVPAAGGQGACTAYG